jgi:hypothetical protein
MRWTVTSLVVAAMMIGTGCEEAPRGSVLREIDSVRVAETEDRFLGRLVGMAVGADGHVFLSDAAHGHVAEVAPDGRIVRTLGRRGRGPGEIERPVALALGGDSVLYVLDNGTLRMNRFDLRSGEFLSQTPPLGFSVFGAQLRQVGDEMMLTYPDAKAGTSLLTLTPEGERKGSEGIIPSIGVTYPMLLVQFTNVAFDVAGDEVYAAYDLSPSIFRWKRGERTAIELPIPAVRRRGATDAHFEELIRDPANAGAKAYDHSMPRALAYVEPSTLLLLTMDLQLLEGGLVSTLHASVVDLDKRRVCPDIELPLPRDPLPQVALLADTIVAVQQSIAADSSSSSAIRRFVVDREACEWRNLPL